MTNETATVTAEVAVPSFLKRIPVKKAALATIAVAGVAAIAVFAKDHLNVDIATDETASED